jgi:hypothetical protein
MKVFKYEENQKDYNILLDSKGILMFSGRYLPKDASIFFEPVMEWIRKYVLKPQDNTIVQFKLEYFNTSSSKIILDIMSALRDLADVGKNIEIEWHYKNDDMDLLDAGKAYSELIDFEFRYIMY